MGVISAIGIGVGETLRSLLEGRSGIGRIAYLETSHCDLPSGEVKLNNSGLCALLGLDFKSDYARTALLGAVAVREALSSAGILEAFDTHTALVSGTTVGGMDVTERHICNDAEENTNWDFITRQDCGSATEFVTDLFPVFDFSTTSSTACSSAANAILFGRDLICSGRYDRVVAGGSESLSRFHLNGFNSLQILDREPCRPFDSTRAGLNLGEGAGYVVLESERSVKERGARPLCLLAGCGNACDAYHQTASSPDGEGAFLAMNKALKDSGLKPSMIDYVNAHGTGTQNNDLSEGRALERVFGIGKVPPVSSTKSFTGHTTSASGGIEAVISILALQYGFVPSNLNFSRQMEELSFVPSTAGDTGRDIRNVLCNAFGFGGNDTSVIFSKTEESK